jgi:uncharacterized protein
MPFVIALISGFLFGAGLMVAGMTNPQRVLNFLDIAAIRTGKWDPTLLMVFVGALPLMFAAYRFRGATPHVAERFHLPDEGAVDAPLVAGSTMFGIGWGLVGLCPGPAVAGFALVSAPMLPAAAVFGSALLTGVWLAVLFRAATGARPQVAV